MKTIKQIKLELLGVAVLMSFAAGVRAQSVEFIHTDALGTPIAVTNQVGTVVERSGYEPYGQLLDGTITDGPGFTGHVQDAVTGLTYMQQRYYDPLLAGFLSADPLEARSEPIAYFHRYRYAFSNPFRYYDPSGMSSEDSTKPPDPEPEPTEIDPIVVVGTPPEPIPYVPLELLLDVETVRPSLGLFGKRKPPIGEKTFSGYVGACRDYVGLPWELVAPATAGGLYGEIGKVMDFPGARTAAKYFGPIGRVTASYEVLTTALCSLAGIQTLQ